MNRGNNKQAVFHDDRDFEKFVGIVREAKATVPVKLYAFTLMHNHFHLVLQPRDIDTMSRYMHRAQKAGTVAHHHRYDTSGHLWQSRYKGFPVQDDSHFLTVIRYVLQNPVRAGLARRSRDYPWTSLSFPDLVDPWPVERPTDIDGWLSDPLDDDLLNAVRRSANAQFPFGSTTWMNKTAVQLGIKLTAPRRSPSLGTGTPQTKQPPNKQ